MYMGFNIEITLPMKIDQEEFNRKAQHILDTVVKPQVERYEKAKAEGTLRRLTEEIKNDPWHVKLRRWWKFKRWVWSDHSSDLSFWLNSWHLSCS